MYQTDEAETCELFCAIKRIDRKGTRQPPASPELPLGHQSRYDQTKGIVTGKTEYRKPEAECRNPEKIHVVNCDAKRLLMEEDEMEYERHLSEVEKEIQAFLNLHQRLRKQRAEKRQAQSAVDDNHGILVQHATLIS